MEKTRHAGSVRTQALFKGGKMSRAALSIVLSIVSLTCLLNFPAIAQTQPEKWEYKYAQICSHNTFDSEMKKLGDEGWELVFGESTPGCHNLYFKRPKKERFTPIPPAPAGPPKCNLTLAQVPAIRGIRLGMSTDELLALFPRSKEQAETIKALRNAEANYGEVNLYFRLGTYPENKEMFSNNISYYGVTLLDGRVASFTVDYNFSTQDNRNPEWTYRTWILKLSETYNLPKPEDWFSSGANYASIDCQDLRMYVNASSNSASIAITGPPVHEQIKQRREAASERLRREFKP
jgi:hypothetical protein